MHTLELSVIIVNYNVKYYVEQCLVSLQRALQGVEAEILVVDNASQDGSVAYLSDKFPHVTFISNNHNLGFARANNLAIRQSSGKYVLLLNPDTIVGEDTIRQLVDFMDGQSKLGAVGVRMISTQGSDAKESRRGIPTPLTAFYKMCGLCAKYPKHKRFARYYLGHLPWDKPAEIEIVSGAFFAVPRTSLEDIGLLDEDFFMYGEDIDLSYRLLKGGYHNWYLPLRILHYKGESTQKSSFRYVHVFYEAMLIFFQKHFGGMSLFLSLPIKLAIYFKATIALIQMQIGKTRKSLGLFHPQRYTSPFYVFIGSSESMLKCQKIAERKGLKAKFIVATAAEYPEGHLAFELPQTSEVCVVYDIEAYTFSQIFHIFSKGSQSYVHLGTFNPMNEIVITPSEILK